MLNYQRVKHKKKTIYRIWWKDGSRVSGIEQNWQTTHQTYWNSTPEIRSFYREIGTKHQNMMIKYQRKHEFSRIMLICSN
jgi:hypothetical protein